MYSRVAPQIPDPQHQERDPVALGNDAAAPRPFSPRAPSARGGGGGPSYLAEKMMSAWGAWNLANTHANSRALSKMPTNCWTLAST